MAFIRFTQFWRGHVPGVVETIDDARVERLLAVAAPFLVTDEQGQPLPEPKAEPPTEKPGATEEEPKPKSRRRKRKSAQSESDSADADQ